MTTTKEHGMLFSGEMVRRLLDGSKTQTRRPMKEQPSADADWIAFDNSTPPQLWSWRGPRDESAEPWERIKVPIAVGDHLWVRETFAFCVDNVGTSMVTYRASPCSGRAVLCDHEGEGDYVGTKEHDNVPACTGPWRPSIHMPRWASRITLEVTSVRVERIQDISEEDARAEGVEMARELYTCPKCGFVDDDEQDGDGHWEQGTSQHHEDEPGWSYWTLSCNRCGEVNDMPLATAKERFRQLWEQTYPGSWQRNDWVWVYSFQRV